MERVVSKSSFKAKALEYLREVESTGKELVITDHGKPVLKVVPYSHDPQEALRSLRGSVIRYVDPLEPVGLEDWEASFRVKSTTIRFPIVLTKATLALSPRGATGM